MQSNDLPPSHELSNEFITKQGTKQHSMARKLEASTKRATRWLPHMQGLGRGPTIWCIVGSLGFEPIIS